MRLLTFILFSVLTVNSFGQNFEKGIYRGQRLPFEICYFTYLDSLLEVEYFYEKAGQIFGHVPAKKLKINMESFATKPAFISIDDSIKVFFKKYYFLITRKGFKEIKVYQSKETRKEITTLRNKNQLFSFSQQLLEKMKKKSGFEEKEFWNKLNSFELDRYIELETYEFNDKLETVKNEINKNWR